LKRQFYLSCFLLLVMCASFGLQNDFPVLKGPYLGQKPPGIIPEIFASGIISTDANEGSSGFLRNGSVFVFSRSHSDTDKSEIYMTQMKNGTWTQPEPAPFDSRFSDGDYTVASDGRTLYFTSRRSLRGKDEESESSNIWVTEIMEGDWSILPDWIIVLTSRRMGNTSFS